MMKQSPEGETALAYRSGTAARLAGIPVATLRVWERRYGVVGPRMSPSGHRRYSAADVSRLALVKQLVDLGFPIGSIANLPLPALREMHAGSGAAPHDSGEPPASARPLRVALVGEGLAAQAASARDRIPSVEIVAACADRSQAAQALHGVAADLLAIELPALREDAIGLVDALVAAIGARHAVVSYRFGTEAAVHSLRDRGHVVAHAPLDLAALESFAPAGPTAGATAVVRPLPGVPARRFDERALAELARTPTAVQCECPRHVVDLLLSLGAFERYSAECQHRSPADAALHRDLQRVAGTARAMFEDALARIARAEGLPLLSRTSGVA
jgi:MerR family transcriptional regulator, light-induced transcriptional regulator